MPWFGVIGVLSLLSDIRRGKVKPAYLERARRCRPAAILYGGAESRKSDGKKGMT